MKWIVSENRRHMVALAPPLTLSIWQDKECVLFCYNGSGYNVDLAEGTEAEMLYLMQSIRLWLPDLEGNESRMLYLNAELKEIRSQSKPETGDT